MFISRNKQITSNTIHIQSRITSSLTTPRRNHIKSIHALNPSCIKNMAFKTNCNNYSPNHNIIQNRNTSCRDSEQSYASQEKRKNGLIQSLFIDEKIMLNKLQRQTSDLINKKQSIIKNNEKQYQNIVYKMLEIRRKCNKRKQDIDILKKQLKNVQNQKLYKKIKHFSWRSQSQGQRNSFIRTSLRYEQKRNQETFNFINNKLVI